MKAFYCQVDFTAEIRSRRDSHKDRHQNCYQIFGRRNTQRRHSEENVGEKFEDLKAQGMKRQHTRMKGTTKWIRSVSGVKVIHGPKC